MKLLYDFTMEPIKHQILEMKHFVQSKEHLYAGFDELSLYVLNHWMEANLKSFPGMQYFISQEISWDP